MIARTSGKGNIRVLPGASAPQAVEAEEALLGALQVAPDMIKAVRDYVQPEDFYILRNAYICEALYRIDERGEKADFVTLQQELNNMGRLNDVGGPAYLLRLINNTPTSTHALTYAQLVQRASIRRNLLRAGDEIKALAVDEELPLEQVIAEAQRRIGVVETPHQPQHLRIQDSLDSHFERLKERRETGVLMNGIPSVIPQLGRLLGGYQRGKLIVTAGRPGLGKSSHLYSEIVHVCDETLQSVLVVSLEVNRMEIIDNLTSVLTGLPVLKIRSGQMNDEEWDKYVGAINRMDQWKLFIADAVGVTPFRIRQDALALRRMSGLDMIVVDYLQLLNPDTNNRNWSRAEEVGSFAKALKELAVELDVPVIAAAQLNRSVEHRQDKRPTLADLRESGDIEQSADVVIGIHREDYYQPVGAASQDAFSHTEFIVLKNRDGQTGVVNAGFYRNAKRFVPAYQQDGVWQYEYKNLLVA